LSFPRATTAVQPKETLPEKTSFSEQRSKRNVRQWPIAREYVGLGGDSKKDCKDNITQNTAARKLALTPRRIIPFLKGLHDGNGEGANKKAGQKRAESIL
jgi:hypothetical protein